MATFVNAKTKLGSSATDVYECPAGKTAIVIGCQVANRLLGVVELEFWWTDASDGNAVTYLGDGIGVPGNAAYEPIGGKLVLAEGDKLRGLGNQANELEVTVSVLEL